MKDTTKKYADEAYDIICHAANVIGSRLPGSKGEKEYAKYMGDKLAKIRSLAFEVLIFSTETAKECEKVLSAYTASAPLTCEVRRIK